MGCTAAPASASRAPSWTWGTSHEVTRQTARIRVTQMANLRRTGKLQRVANPRRTGRLRRMAILRPRDLRVLVDIFRPAQLAGSAAAGKLSTSQALCLRPAYLTRHLSSWRVVH